MLNSYESIQVFRIISYLILIFASIRWIHQLLVSQRVPPCHKLRKNNDDADVITDATTSTIKRPLKGLGKSVSLKGLGYRAEFLVFKKSSLMVGSRHQEHSHLECGVSHREADIQDTMVPRKNSLSSEELKEVADAFIARMQASFQLHRLDSFEEKQLEEPFHDENENTRPAYVVDVQKHNL